MKQEIEGDSNNLAGRDINITSITQYKPHTKPFYPQDIRLVIEGFECCFSKYCDKYGNIVVDRNDEMYDFDYIEKEKKNKLNSLSSDYFEYIQREHLASFYKIDSFLKDPKNIDILGTYNLIAKMIRFRIAIIRSQHTVFDTVLGDIYEELIESNECYFSGKEDLCVIFINYMYWNCDIGKKVE